MISMLLPAVAYGENSFTLSYTETSGNSKTETLSASYQLSRNWGVWGISSDGSFLYKKSSGKETANRLSAEVNGKRSLNDRLSLIVNGFIYSDRFSGYDFRAGLGPGISYQLSSWATVSTSVNYTYNNYTNGKVENYWESQTQLEMSKEFKRFTLSQKFSYQVSLKNGNDYFLHSRSEISVPLNSRLALSVVYSIDYQNRLPSGVEYHTDRTLLTGITYRF